MAKVLSFSTLTAVILLSMASMLPIISSVVAIRISSGICLDWQNALPLELKVEQTHTGPEAVFFRL